MITGCASGQAFTRIVRFQFLALTIVYHTRITVYPRETCVQYLISDDI
jgi:hypothetical protein